MERKSEVDDLDVLQAIATLSSPEKPRPDTELVGLVQQTAAQVSREVGSGEAFAVAMERGMALLHKNLATVSNPNANAGVAAAAAAWRDSLVNRLIEVEFGNLWYTCRVVVDCKRSTNPLLMVFRVRYEEDDTEQDLVLNEDFTAHTESDPDVFQWRIKTEEIANEKAVRIEKSAQDKALITERKANAKAMKIEKDAQFKALRMEKESNAKCALAEREMQQRCLELEQQCQTRMVEVERLEAERVRDVTLQLEHDREVLDADRKAFELEKQSYLETLAAATAAALGVQKKKNGKAATAITTTVAMGKKEDNPLVDSEEEEEGEEEEEEEEEVMVRRMPSSRISRPVDVFKPQHLPHKKKTRHSEPLPKVSSPSTRQRSPYKSKLKSLGYIPKGRFGFVPPEREQAVGWRVRIYWKEDKTFYRGQIESYVKKKHRVVYEDGEEEMVLLSGERVEWFLPADSEFESYGIDVAEVLEAQKRT
ncbi:hypothetical protein BASA81_003106 [Batrachochytrium salamandrivorans]|nr:hypothetical protein BASA81_003106 [Batrachochytrium salamandrivorans]